MSAAPPMWWLLEAVNPLGLTAGQYAGAWAAKCGGVVVFDRLCLALERAWAGGRELGSRGTPQHLAHRARFRFGFTDRAFHAINSFIDFVFLLHLGCLVVTSRHVAWGIGEATLANTLGAMFLVFVVDDTVYALWHRLMHWGPLYPLCHKHHHRQKFPEYGFFDGANVHPVEEAAAVLIIFMAYHVTSRLLGFHVVALALSFLLFAFVNVANHSKFDITFNYFGPIGYQYTVGAHELHHRHYFVNYGKFCLWADKVMGTYKAYHGDGSK